MLHTTIQKGLNYLQVS